MSAIPDELLAAVPAKDSAEWQRVLEHLDDMIWKGELVRDLAEVELGGGVPGYAALTSKRLLWAGSPAPGNLVWGAWELDTLRAARIEVDGLRVFREDGVQRVFKNAIPEAFCQEVLTAFRKDSAEWQRVLELVDGVVLTGELVQQTAEVELGGNVPGYAALTDTRLLWAGSPAPGNLVWGAWELDTLRAARIEVDGLRVFREDGVERVFKNAIPEAFCQEVLTAFGLVEQLRSSAVATPSGVGIHKTSVARSRRPPAASGGSNAKKIRSRVRKASSLASQTKPDKTPAR